MCMCVCDPLSVGPHLQQIRSLITASQVKGLSVLEQQPALVLPDSAH